MRRTIFLLGGLAMALPAAAAPAVAVKCGANQEKVWVYDNLKTFDVSARLKCGASVEILGLENGYVKIRMAEGNEGYLPADALPERDVAQLSAAAAPPTVAQAARPPAPAALPSAPAAAPAAVTSAKPISAAVPAILPPAQISSDITITVTPDAVPAPSAKPPSKGAVHAAAVPVAAAEKKTVIPSNRTPSARTAAAARSTSPASARVTLMLEPAGSASLVAASSAAPAVLRTADLTPLAKKPALDLDEDEDGPDPEALATPDLSACNVFFTAYGVTPMQYKWIAGDLPKKFPGVCPAPEPALVDYVVILTHDMDFFTTTLPDPIHTDSNGFSDWSPVTAADDALIPASSLDRARYEYAWVFRVRRGTFDPAKFSPRRRPQFTRTESSARASSKSIEDAMQFMAASGPAH